VAVRGWWWVGVALMSLRAGASAAQPACVPVPIVEDGQPRGTVCPADAAARGLTVLDLSDEWLPFVLVGTAEQPQPMRSELIDLANERFGRDPEARHDRYLELYGVAPSLSVLARRLRDEPRHACHDGVEDGALGAWYGARGVRPLDLARAEVRVAQMHLACDGLLRRDVRSGRLDVRTVTALQAFQRRHALPDHGRLDRDTRIALTTDSRELDFRGLLRVLREHVADAAALIEDGTGAGGPGPVLGRLLDGAELRERFAQPAHDSPGRRSAPDLVSPATEAAARALGWTSPERVTAAPVASATRVAVRLPPLPAYHGPRMELRAEIDRGEVWLAAPLDGRGQLRRRVARHRPTLAIIARDAGGELVLARWPTTIGGWQPVEDRDGSFSLRYKESRAGRAIWRDLMATPKWHPPPGTPTQRLCRLVGDRWELRRELIGPGYRAAHGLVALVHHDLVGRALVDHRIRTHGSPSYRSIGRGESHGCHRLYNHLALRLAGFLLRHRDHVRHGIIQQRGYRFELTPPVPVDVLEGEVHGSRRAVARSVPLAERPR
jgi:hypothetical protein